MSTRFISLYEC